MIELVSTPTAILTILPICAAIVAFSLTTRLGAASLPSMTMFVSLISFYIMPVLALVNGDEGFYGLYITTLEWVHLAAGLYCLGAGLACFVFIRVLRKDPAAPRPDDRPYDQSMFVLMAGACAIAVPILAATGQLNVTASDDFQFAEERSNVLFLNLFITSLAPLALVYAVREDFSWRGVLAVLIVLGVFVQAAFRFRIMLLGFGFLVSYALARNIRIRLAYTVLGLLGGLFLANLLGATRRYGNGLDFTNLQDVTFLDLLQSFGGEVGTIYAFFFVVSTPLPEAIGATPWLVGLARLVPSYFWPDKPFPTYLEYAATGFPNTEAYKAGIATPQQAEILMQFGWAGLPALAFLYFALICLLMARLNRLGREARIVGCALVPAFFGYYMQSRGYFSQYFNDMLFTFVPLFLLSCKPRANQRHFTN